MLQPQGLTLLVNASGSDASSGAWFYPFHDGNSYMYGGGDFADSLIGWSAGAEAVAQLGSTVPSSLTSSYTSLQSNSSSNMTSSSSSSSSMSSVLEECKKGSPAVAHRTATLAINVANATEDSLDLFVLVQVLSPLIVVCCVPE